MTNYGTKGGTYTRWCAFCDEQVTVTGSVAGASECCDACAKILWAIGTGASAELLPPRFMFPLFDAHPVSCGNRADLPRRERRHDWRYLGTDPRHTETGFEELHVYACATCGRDRQTRAGPREQEN